MEVIVFCKSLSLLWDSSSRHIVAFFETSVNIKVLIPKCWYQSFKITLLYILFDKTFITYIMVTFFHSFILWLFHAFLYKWIFFGKLKNSVEAYLSVLIDNSIFVVWWVFIKRIKLQSNFSNNDNAYVKVLIQNKKDRKHRKTKNFSFPKK